MTLDIPTPAVGRKGGGPMYPLAGTCDFCRRPVVLRQDSEHLHKYHYLHTDTKALECIWDLPQFPFRFATLNGHDMIELHA